MPDLTVQSFSRQKIGRIKNKIHKVSLPVFSKDVSPWKTGDKANSKELFLPYLERKRNLIRIFSEKAVFYKRTAFFYGKHRIYFGFLQAAKHSGHLSIERGIFRFKTRLQYKVKVLIKF